MLVSLHVKNLALIDETEVFFDKGLNILSGETGAGKSIIIGSVNLALGARAEKDLIRKGAEYALIELLFQVDSKEVEDAVNALEIPLEDDKLVLIQRKIMPNRSVCKVCGETVTARQLKDLASILIDIHGQHEHQSLLSVKKHLEFLDDYCKEDLFRVKENIAKEYSSYLEISKKLEDALTDASKREREISMLEFESKEIEEADLKIKEDEFLETAYRKMVNAKKIKEGAHIAYAYSGYEQGAGELIGRTVRELKAVSSYDIDLAELEGQAEELDTLLNDFNRSLSDYLSELEFDEADFRKIEERLNVINHLKTKYGNTIEKIVEYNVKQQETLEILLHFDEYKKNLEVEKEKIQKQLNVSCEKASKIRKKAALTLQKAMEEALFSLNFNAVTFVVNITRKATYTVDGFDDGEFMISLNPGEEVRSLATVASGGELSRIMLAIKTVMAKKDDINTLIFDEIDAGISGKTAWKVSEKLAVLGSKHQVICITHLPQIAAMADHHFVITKQTKDNITTTSIAKLKEEEMLLELARMLGGDSITQTVLLNAKELKELARKTKVY